MSKWPAASREDHDSFCTMEQWELKRGASGKLVKHHRTYILTLWNGRILRTRISRPIDRTQYSASMWDHILRQQLEIGEDDFWACVHSKVLPNRGGPTTVPLRKPVPLYLYRALKELDVDDPTIAELDAPGAAELYAKLLKK